MKNLYMLVLLISLSYLSFAMDNYKLDSDNSKIGFEIIKFKIGAPVNGEFKDFDGNAHFNENDMTLSNTRASILVSSIDTQNVDRNKHLISDENFFNEKKYKNIQFKQVGKTTLRNGAIIKGNLTIKNVTQAINLTITNYKVSNNEVIINAEGKLNRLDYGVSWNAPLEKSKWKKVLGKLGKFVLDDEVKLILKASLKK